MSDESCGCRCLDCRMHDVHQCGNETCAYTKVRRHRERAQAGKSKFEPVADAVDMLRGELRVGFRKIQSPESRARLLEWARFVEETAELEPEVRQMKRNEKMLELFGWADYRRNAVTREEASEP